ncbi:hypothetical protein B0T16DRAFT_455970 [Cercophora newfieldiana]|uniref:Uncharacterized protein n=1 Tax=Cercophora newfieldiana TaxID=92897 RepID=A0AA39Y9M1_9PEZI|nr:hypothetical protein B0T16DRAFT_455970 [Cercophora newfieldiana]
MAVETHILDESDFGLGQLDRFCRPWRFQGGMSTAVRPELEIPQNGKRLEVLHQLLGAIKESKYKSLNGLRREMREISGKFLEENTYCPITGDHLLSAGLQSISAIMYDQVCAGVNAPPLDYKHYPEHLWDACGPPTNTLDARILPMCGAWIELVRENIYKDYNLPGNPPATRSPKHRLNIILFTQHMVEMARRCSQGSLPDAQHWKYLGQQMRRLNRAYQWSDRLAFSDIAMHLYYHWIYHCGDLAQQRDPHGLFPELTAAAAAGNPDRLIRKISVQMLFYLPPNKLHCDMQPFLGAAEAQTMFETNEALAAQYGIAVRSFRVRHGREPRGALGIAPDEGWITDRCSGSHGPRLDDLDTGGKIFVAIWTVVFFWLLWWFLKVVCNWIEGVWYHTSSVPIA